MKETDEGDNEIERKRESTDHKRVSQRDMRLKTNDIVCPASHDRQKSANPINCNSRGFITHFVFFSIAAAIFSCPSAALNLVDTGQTHDTFSPSNVDLSFSAVLSRGRILGGLSTAVLREIWQGLYINLGRVDKIMQQAFIKRTIPLVKRRAATCQTCTAGLSSSSLR